MSDPFDQIVIRAIFTTASGETLRRDWTVREIEEHDKPFSDPPEWLKGTLRTWDKPGDPITFKGHVMPGHEDEARALLGIEK